jgi:hypothetical protein
MTSAPAAAASWTTAPPVAPAAACTATTSRPDPAGQARQHVSRGAVHGDGGGRVQRHAIGQRDDELGRHRGHLGVDAAQVTEVHHRRPGQQVVGARADRHDGARRLRALTAIPAPERGPGKR